MHPPISLARIPALSTIYSFNEFVTGKYDLNPFVEFLILPYTFIAGMSYFAGWGALSFILVIISILFITLIIYPIVILVIKDPRKNI